MSRFPRRLALLFGLLTAALSARAEGPQHWGFGQGYLAGLVEREGGGRDLVVWGGPSRAVDKEWLVRWRHDKLVTGQGSAWIAIGDFKPKAVGKAYLAVATADAAGIEVGVYEPPEVFSTRPWALLPSGKRLIATKDLLGDPIGVAAGNLLGSAGDADSVVVLLRGGEGLFVAWVKPGMVEGADATLVRRERLTIDVAPENVRGFAVGDFWGTGEDAVCVAALDGEKTVLRFLRWGKEVSPSACFVKVAEDLASNIPPLAQDGLTAGDFFKDGFDALMLAPADPEAPLHIRVAPSRELSKPRDTGPIYNGCGLSGLYLPGSGGAMSLPSLSVRVEIPGGRKKGPLPLAAGPVFGYVKPDPVKGTGTTLAIDDTADAEIAFVHRVNTPKRGEGAPNFGWPVLGEETAWQVAIHNIGATQVPAGTKVRVWTCAKRPNADIAGEKPDEEWQWEALTALEPDKPKYFLRTVKGTWPYALEEMQSGTWKRLNLAEVGERWLIVSIEEPGGGNERNNRIEIPWNGLAYHPVFRNGASIADRRPVVDGDPPSREYLARKLADAVNVMWERSGTGCNADSGVRVYFDGYEVGWTSDLPEKDKAERLRWLSDRYDACPEVDARKVGAWERLGWKDGDGELKDLAKLLHPMPDLDEARVSAAQTGMASKADMTPVQLATVAWGPDVLATGHTRFGVAAAEWASRYMAGARGAPLPFWREMAPGKVTIRILDRDGKPVPDANLAIIPAGKPAALRAGRTDMTGKWDVGHPFDSAILDAFGRKRWKAGLVADTGMIVTIAIGFYSEAILLGADDVTSHGRVALFSHSLTDEREWIVDVRVNWIKEAPPADFALEAPVQGNSVELRARATGGGQRIYRVYRRHEPAWKRTLLGEYPSGDGSMIVPIDLGAPDAWGKDRHRATFEVTAMIGGVESQARSVFVTAVQEALGLTRFAEGKFVVASTPGKADPWALLTSNSTPDREFLAHPKPGHIARKLLRSTAKPSRMFVTLKASDVEPPCYFDILDNPPGGGWATNYDLGGTTGKRGTIREFRVKDHVQLGELNIGDYVTWNAKTGRVTSIVMDAVTVEPPIFDLENQVVKVTFTRAAGLAGNSAPARELRDPRGMITLKVGDREFLVICDTGNERFVVWDDTTKYICGYGGDKFRPVALANDPRDSRVFFVVERRADRKSHVLRFTFNGKSLEKDHTWNLDAGDWKGDEQGLSCRALGDELGRVQLAITDGEKGRVLLVTVTPDRLVPNGVITTIAGPHAGPDSLTAPLDALFVPLEKNAFKLFLIDGKDRIVEAGAPSK